MIKSPGVGTDVALRDSHELTFNIIGSKMWVDMWRARDLYFTLTEQAGKDLFAMALNAHPEVNEIRGEAELDNLVALNRFKDIRKTPFGIAMTKLGFTDLSADYSAGYPPVLVAKRPLSRK
ncbi:MAG TPA: hypothetical protein VGI81_10355 [Tepidisphaeraceae bacterium]